MQTVKFTAADIDAPAEKPITFRAEDVGAPATATPSTPTTPESWADWAINKLPVAGGVVGGLIGSTLGPLGAITGGLFGASGAEAYKELINRARGRPAPSTPTDAANQIAGQGIWQGAVPETAGAVAGPVLRATGTKLMQSAVKPTLAAAKRATGGTPQLVQTLLEEGISISQRGYDKLTALIEATNEQIKEAIAGSTAEISPLKVASRLTPVAQRVAQQVNPTNDLAAVSQVGQEFLEHPSITGPTMPIQQAQAMKVGTYRSLAGKYGGELKSAEIEAQKGLARGLKEEIAAEIPNISALNAREGKLLQAADVVGRRVALTGNRDPIAFAWVTHNPITFLAALADRSTGFKSLLARGAYGAAGSAAKVSPQLIRAAVLAVAQSPDDQAVTPPPKP